MGHPPQKLTLSVCTFVHMSVSMFVTVFACQDVSSFPEVLSLSDVLRGLTYRGLTDIKGMDSDIRGDGQVKFEELTVEIWRGADR